MSAASPHACVCAWLWACSREVGSQCGAHRSRADPHFLLHAAERAAAGATGGSQAPASISQPSLWPTPRSGISSATHPLPARALGPALAPAAEPSENVTLSALAGGQEGLRFSACTCVPSDTFPPRVQRGCRHAHGRAPGHIPTGLHAMPIPEAGSHTCTHTQSIYMPFTGVLSYMHVCVGPLICFHEPTRSPSQHAHMSICMFQTLPNRYTVHVCVCLLRCACAHELTALCTYTFMRAQESMCSIRNSQ